jgi:hypothetical protein
VEQVVAVVVDIEIGAKNYFAQIPSIDEVENPHDYYNH